MPVLKSLFRKHVSIAYEKNNNWLNITSDPNTHQQKQVTITTPPLH